MPFDYYRKSDTPKRSGGRSEKSSQPPSDDEQERKKGLTKSVVKRKRSVEEEEDNLEFTFTPTHPDKRRARTSSAESSETAASGSSRPKRVGAAKKASSNAPIDTPATNSSKKFVNTVELGVSTKIPSKASIVSPEKVEFESSSVPLTAAASRPRRNSSQPTTPNATTPKKRKSLTREPVEEEMEPNEPKRPKGVAETIEEEEEPAPSTPPSSKKRSQSKSAQSSSSSAKKQKKADLNKSDISSSAPEPTMDTEEAPPSERGPTTNGKSSSTRKSSSRTKESQKPRSPTQQNPPVIAPNEEPRPSTPPKPTDKTSKKSRLKNSTANSSKAGTKAASSSSLPLEENLISYWDFVNIERSDRLIRRLTHVKSDGTSRIGREAETSLRLLQGRFFAEAEARFRPADEYEHNPVNDQLEGAKERYARIIELLERENEELESVHSHLSSSLQASESLVESRESFGPTTPSRSTVSRPTSTVKASAKKAGSSNAGPHGETGTDSSMINASTASIVDEIILTLPPGDSLLTEEDRLFLAERPARSGALELISFGRLQTKLDALELLSKQIAQINDTFEDKASAASSAMREFMIPAKAPLSLASLPPASPGFLSTNPFN